MAILGQSVLDTSFGSNGKVVNPTGLLAGSPETIILPGNKVLLTDVCHGDIFFTPPRLCFTRLNEDGSYDTHRTTPVPGVSTAGSPWSNAGAYQTDGKIVIAGGLVDGDRRESVLMRYNADGGIDTSFGVNGFVINQPVGTSEFHNLIVQDDGKLVLSAVTTSMAEIIVRFDQNGLLDPSFGQGGIVSGAGRSIVMLPDGRLLAVGSGQTLSRLHPNGAFDTSFGGGDGQVDIGVAGKQVAYRADGRIFVLSNFRSVHRFTVDGLPDLTFNGTGSVVFFPDFTYVVSGISVTPSGKVTAVGYRDNVLSGLFYYVARCLPDGTPDTTIGPDGLFWVQVQESSAAMSATYDSIGRTVIGGIASIFPNSYQNPLLSAVRLVGPAQQNVRLSGRVVRLDGRAVPGAAVTLKENGSVIATDRSNSFGFFNFYNIPTARTYTVSASSKVVTFREHSIMLDDTIDNFRVVSRDPLL
ncbi:MAG: carboxypeptidase regulatory-like domain-containing protein [Pyrinomonadaceae bacterium]